MRPSRNVFAAISIAIAISVASLSVRAAGQTVQERLGYPANARLLIIHADDLGMSHSVNRATFAALENKWITSSSILVPCPWFPEAAAWARTHQDADLGIHLALTSEWTTFRWGPVTGRSAVPSLLDKDGYMPLLETTAGAQAKPNEAERELRAQVDMAKAAGVAITHVDSHMGTLFQNAALFDVFRRVAASYNVPPLIEEMGNRGGDQAPWLAGVQKDALITQVVTLGASVPPDQWESAYEKMLAPLGPGVYQLIVHLGYDDEEMRGATADHPDWGAAWRQSDFDTMRSDKFRSFLRDQKFVLVGWKDVAKARK
jgi:predicted glycoside hydrolase/deacetylase ChbG (UPF0249 family)